MKPLWPAMAILSAMLVTASSVALAAGGCVPQAGAKVLRAPAAGAVHPDWQGGSRLGSSWSLVGPKRIMNNSGAYITGTLVSPRGGYRKKVYGLAKQWSCE